MKAFVIKLKFCLKNQKDKGLASLFVLRNVNRLITNSGVEKLKLTFKKASKR